MAQTNVASCVLSIVASFTSGLDVFKKFRDARSKRKRGSKKNGSIVEEEVKLARSLRQGPEDIGREYQKSIQVVGDHFASGDAIAQTSLAEILLKLNTGLVTIINTFLARDKKEDIHLDYHSLTSLSERSRIDTCRTLRHLYRRMVQAGLPLRMPSIDSIQLDSVRGIPRAQARAQVQPKARSETSEVDKKRQKTASNVQRTKVRGPMLARVVIADSSRPSQVALVRPGERKKLSRGSSSPDSAEVQSSVALTLPAPMPSSSTDAVSRPPARPRHQRSKTAPELPEARHQHSAMDIRRKTTIPRPETPRITQSDPRKEAAMQDTAPAPPTPYIPPATPHEPRRRKPTPTYHSIETTSTKLGEIPLHKWAEPYDFDAMSRLNREAERDGWPLNSLDDAQRTRRRGMGILRFFRKGKPIR